MNTSAVAPSAPQISEEFAKQLLRAMYALDEPIGKLDSILGLMPEGEAKDRLVAVIGDLMCGVSDELMLPIYRARPGLGRVSEPGEWLKSDAGA